MEDLEIQITAQAISKNNSSEIIITISTKHCHNNHESKG